MLTAANIAGTPGVRHGFFSRRGGVSEGLFKGLNCSYGADDEAANVDENRRLALARLGFEGKPLITVYQSHSADAVVVERPWPPGLTPRADAMVTARPGLVLGILTADCAPVLFADGRAGVVAAAHAGWRGAKSGVLERCLETMLKEGANAAAVTAAVGPCIGVSNYETGAEFYREFIADGADNDRFFKPSPRPGHRLFDLGAYVMGRLEAMELASTEFLDQDTCADAELFYSYRRGTLAGAPDHGRLLSAIAITED